MAVSKKGERRLQYHQQEFLWYVADWDLGEDHSLHIMSADKAIQLRCGLHHERQEIVVVQSEELPPGKYPFSLNLGNMGVKPSDVKKILDWYFEPR